MHYYVHHVTIIYDTFSNTISYQQTARISSTSFSSLNLLPHHLFSPLVKQWGQVMVPVFVFVAITLSTRSPLHSHGYTRASYTKGLLEELHCIIILSHGPCSLSLSQFD